MTNSVICIVCGKEFEAQGRAKMCSEECKAIRKQSYKSGKIQSAVSKSEAVIDDVTKTVTETVTKPKSKPVVEINPDMKWVLTVKDKASKTFKNIVFMTPDVKVAHRYIDEMRAQKLLSFVSLADTDRIEKYITNDEITKVFKGNLAALTARKVPMDAKSMYQAVMKAIETVQPNEGIIEVDVVAPEPVSTTVA